MTRPDARHRLFSTGNLVRMAVLTAISAVLFLTFEIPIIPPMYKLDFSNIPVLLGSFAMGPWAGMIVLLLKNVVQLIFRGLGSTMGIGNLADVLTGAAYLLPAAFIYQHKKTRKGALIGMGAGVLCQVIVAVIVNYLVMIPFYINAYHMSIDKIVSYATKVIPFVDTEWKFYFLACAPFNLLKAVVISLITYLIYKPLSPILHNKQLTQN